MMRKILVAAISAALVSACSSNDVIRTDAVTESVDVICENRVRNLTLPWNADMRCTETRDPATVEAERVSRINERNTILADKRVERETAAFNKLEATTQALPATADAESAPPVALVAPLEPIDELNSAAMVEKPAQFPDASSATPSAMDAPTASEIKAEAEIEAEVDESIKIWFAEHLRVLGPDGIQFTKELAPMLQGNGRIKLRGVILPHEINGHDLETFSVARALAVKRVLIREVRIDPDRITILHYSPNTAGRYVEVIFNG